MRWSDDADLCDRLRLSGHKFAISKSFVYEIGSEDIKSIIYRWKEYGRGDSKIYMKYSNVWNWKRKIKSYLHPFYVDLILPLINKPNLKKIIIIPFLFFITTIRYYGWLSNSLKPIDK